MITAKNYAAQTRKELEIAIAVLEKKGSSNAKLARIFAETIDAAQHFAIEDEGKIFDAGLRGLAGTQVRLPFDAITVEFYCREPKAKYVVAAIEVPKEDRVDIGFFFSADLGDGWVFLPYIAWLGEISNDNTLTFSFKDANGKDAESKSFSAASFCACAVLELCEALSCSNVTHEPIEKINHGVNARRVRDGKLPLYETRCLVINVSKSAASQTGDGSHASPRQHLRMGHVRRLNSGNVWVNSCVVGTPKNGVIEKSYEVVA